MRCYTVVILQNDNRIKYKSDEVLSGCHFTKW